jgi:hypothetical protein
VPANWPTKDGVTPIAKPHEARNEIVVGKDGKKTSLFTESAVQRAIWTHRGWWNFLESPGYRVEPTPALKISYRRRHERLPPAQLQQLVRWWRRLKIECGDNSDLPSNPSPFPGKRKSALRAGAAEYLEKHEDDGQQRTDDRNGPDLAGDV